MVDVSMNLIVLSHMYPSQGSIYGGAFVEKQVIALRKIIDGEIFVISPIPWAPRVLWFKKKWRDYGEEKKYLIRNNIKVYRPRYFRMPGRHYGLLEPFAMYMGIRTLVKHIISTHNHNFILHAHTVLPDGLTAVLLKKEFHLPVVCTAHGSDIYNYPFRSKLSYHQANTVLTKLDAIVTVSSKLKEIIFDISSRRDGVYVVTNGVDSDWLAPREHAPLDSKIQRILFVGTLCPEKGVPELLKGFSLLSKEYNNIELVLVGRNNMKPWIDSFLSQNDLISRVNITGELSPDKLCEYYSNATIFTLPSHNEGMPTVMFEAMGSGLPVIISDVGGVSEVIKDNVNGLLTKPGNWQDLYLKLKLLLDSETLRDRLGAAAYKDVAMNYTWDINANKMMNIYRLLSQRNSHMKSHIN